MNYHQTPAEYPDTDVLLELILGGYHVNHFAKRPWYSGYQASDQGHVLR